MELHTCTCMYIHEYVASEPQSYEPLGKYHRAVQSLKRNTLEPLVIRTSKLRTTLSTGRPLDLFSQLNSKKWVWL